HTASSRAGVSTPSAALQGRVIPAPTRQPIEGAFPMPTTPSTAEFDAYAAGYAGGMEDPVKQMFGPSLEAFLQRKVNWLLRHVRGQGPLRLLDFGCGTADFLRLLQAGRFHGSLDGFDASAEMIAEAQRRWTGGPPPRLLADASGTLPYPDRSFDVIVACCVFHH